MSEKHLKQFVFETKVLDQENRIIQMIGSTEDFDRVGDRMFMNGLILANYLKNPIILPNHDYESQAIGKSLDVNVVNSQLIFKIQFADTDLGNQWFYLYANKFMNASSIGFIGLEYTPNNQGGYDYTKWELLELSLVTVPCNPNAIQRAFKDGKISKALFDSINKESEVENMKVEEVQALIDKSVKAQVKELKDEYDTEIAGKVKEIETLNAKIKDLEAATQGKSGAKLSQSTCDCLTKACDGIAQHVKSIKSLVNVVDTQDTDGDPDNGDTKDYTQEDINKAVEENIKKILGGNK